METRAETTAPRSGHACFPEAVKPQRREADTQSACASASTRAPSDQNTEVASSSNRLNKDRFLSAQSEGEDSPARIEEDEASDLLCQEDELLEEVSERYTGSSRSQRDAQPTSSSGVFGGFLMPPLSSLDDLWSMDGDRECQAGFMHIPSFADMIEMSDENEPYTEEALDDETFSLSDAISSMQGHHYGEAKLRVISFDALPMLGCGAEDSAPSNSEAKDAASVLGAAEVVCPRTPTPPPAPAGGLRGLFRHAQRRTTPVTCDDSARSATSPPLPKTPARPAAPGQGSEGTAGTAYPGSTESMAGNAGLALRKFRRSGSG